MPDLAFLDSRGLNPPFARPFELCENDTLSSRFTKISDILNTLHEAFFNHVLKIVLFLNVFLCPLLFFWDRKGWTALPLAGLTSLLFLAFSAQPVRICHITMVTLLSSLS